MGYLVTWENLTIFLGTPRLTGGPQPRKRSRPTSKILRKIPSQPVSGSPCIGSTALVESDTAGALIIVVPFRCGVGKHALTDATRTLHLHLRCRKVLADSSSLIVKRSRELLHRRNLSCSGNPSSDRHISSVPPQKCHERYWVVTGMHSAVILPR